MLDDIDEAKVRFICEWIVDGMKNHHMSKHLGNGIRYLITGRGDEAEMWKSTSHTNTWEFSWKLGHPLIVLREALAGLAEDGEEVTG